MTNRDTYTTATLVYYSISHTSLCRAPLLYVIAFQLAVLAIVTRPRWVTSTVGLIMLCVSVT